MIIQGRLTAAELFYSRTAEGYHRQGQLILHDPPSIICDTTASRKMGMVGALMEESVAQFLHRLLPEGHLHAALQKSWNWLDVNIIDLGRQMRVSYLPPLMVYMAAGISGLTAIVGTFFVKDYLGLSAEFLAMLGFWAGIPWALKMPLGHIVDLAWRWKSLLVFLGAALIAASLGIMLGCSVPHRPWRSI